MSTSSEDTNDCSVQIIGDTRNEKDDEEAPAKSLDEEIDEIMNAEDD